jgi:hypothetical protein
MIPKRIHGATRYLGAPKGWNPETDGDCSHLAILDTEGVMISSWEPTPAELKALNAGACVYLQIVGTGHPPVNIWVETHKCPPNL